MNNLANLVQKVMPGISGVTYNEKKNIFLTNGYTSAAGNTYFQGVRLSERIVVKENVGVGYCRTFINGIQIFGFNGKDLQLITSKCYDCTFYDETFIRNECVGMVNEFLKNQCRPNGSTTNAAEIKALSTSLINETLSHKKQLN